MKNTIINTDMLEALKMLQSAIEEGDPSRISDVLLGYGVHAINKAEQELERPKTLREINDQLYGTLCDMLTSRKGHDENGQIDFNQNDLDSMEETYAYIKICYYLETPDGDREEETHAEFVEEGSEQMTDEKAYVELTVRLNNTRIY